MNAPSFDRKWLLERLRFSIGKIELLKLVDVANAIGVEPEEIITISLNNKNSVGFHAAWMLENMMLENQEALDYYLPILIDKFPIIESSSVQRHYAKLIALGIKRVVKKKSSKIFEKELWIINLEPLEEACFKRLLDENSKPAVKANCMEILYLLSTRQKWIAEELPHIIESQMECGTPAIRSKGKKILKKLNFVR